MKQIPSKQVKCEICGNYYAARGIKSHLRLLHQLKVTEQVKEIVQKTYEPINYSSPTSTTVEKGGNLSKHSSTQVQEDISTQVRPTDEQMKINAKQADAFRKWYVRDENGDMMDKEFNTEAEALAQIKKNMDKPFIHKLMTAKGNHLKTSHTPYEEIEKMAKLLVKVEEKRKNKKK